MSTIISASNIKCHGCAKSITTKLQSITEEVSVNVEEGTVTLGSEDKGTIAKVKDTLSKMGYPEQDPTLVQTAKSYVSCAIGRMK